MDDERVVVLQTMEQIRKYLELHPEAADTIDGVACWLNRIRPDNSLDVIRLALDALVARGEMHLEPLPGGRVVYSKRRRADEVH